MGSSADAPSPLREDRAPEASQRLGEALERVHASRTLSRAEQLKHLVAYLREAVLENDPTLFTELSIGSKVFRPRSFDPRQDTIVRAQVHRLRAKLDEYYKSEGQAESECIRFERNSYRPLLVPVEHPDALEPTTPTRQPGFWTGLAVGLAIAAVGAGLLMVWPGARHRGVPAVIAAYPIWAPFCASTVSVVISTPLFFSSDTGIERDYRLNFPADLTDAPKELLRSPASPQWDRWAAFDDVHTISFLQEHLAALGSHVEIRSARQVSASEISGRKTIVVGHPRGAPFLYEVMSSLNFQMPNSQMPPRSQLRPQGRFVNVAPQAGELLSYSSVNTPMEASQEENPDYALVTSLRMPPDGELLSVFGSRVQTSSFIFQKLLDPAFLKQLNETLFGSSGARYKSCQIVLRVDYSKGSPIGAACITHRIRF